VAVAVAVAVNLRRLHLPNEDVCWWQEELLVVTEGLMIPVQVNQLIDFHSLAKIGIGNTNFLCRGRR
jgi:UV DNA damage repair endonuclease